MNLNQTTHFDLGMFSEIRPLTGEEAERYRQMPVGVTQEPDVIRCVAEENGIKQVLEFMADGYSLTRVKT